MVCGPSSPIATHLDEDVVGARGVRGTRAAYGQWSADGQGYEREIL
jgi:hypothetical protein